MGWASYQIGNAGMFDAASLWGFFGVALLLGVTPGPDNLFVLMQSARRGWRMGLCVVLGLCLGLVVHTSAVALGLAAVFAASEIAFSVLKFVGAAYLLYLAWGAWSAPVQPLAMEVARTQADAGAAGLSDAARWLGQGVIMNLTNPKVLIFFLAFLPQFADPGRGSVSLQIMVLGAVFIAATLLVFGAIACAAGTFGALLQRSAGAQRWLGRASALIFAGLALRLAFMEH